MDNLYSCLKIKNVHLFHFYVILKNMINKIRYVEIQMVDVKGN